MSKKHNTPASSHDKNLNKVEESLSETHLYHGPIPAPHTLEKFNKIIADDYEQVLDNIKDIYTIKAMRGEYGPNAQMGSHHHAQAQTPEQHITSARV